MHPLGILTRSIAYFSEKWKGLLNDATFRLRTFENWFPREQNNTHLLECRVTFD